MPRAFRVDADSVLKPTRLADGSIYTPAYIARTGVQTYRFADGSERVEYRPPEEVFAQKSLDGWKFAALTVGHPTQDVSTDNWRNLAVGHMDGAPSKQTAEGVDYVAGGCIIRDRAAIDAVDRGSLSALSGGYFVDYDPTPGVTPQNERYDGVQRNIQPNHVALLPPGAGRAGPNVRLYLDANSDRQVGYAIDRGSDTPMAMTAEEQAAFDRLKAERDALKSRADALEKTAADAPKPDALDARVDMGVRIRTDAVAVNPAIAFVAEKDGKPVRLTDREIMVATVRHSDSTFNADGESDDYVRGRFDFAVAQARKTSNVSRNDTRSTDNVNGMREVVAQRAADTKQGGAEIKEDADDGNSAVRAKARWDEERKKDWRTPVTGVSK